MIASTPLGLIKGFVRQTDQFIRVVAVFRKTGHPQTDGHFQPLPAEANLDFLDSLSSLNAEQTRMVMRDNAAGLTATANP